MKTNCIAISILLMCCIPTFSQTCLPDGIMFATQSEVDSFSVLYPNCTEIEGNLIINDTDTTRITNLNAFNNLIKINGSLSLLSSLENLNGLDNIVEIGGTLSIIRNRNLTNILGLKNLKNINGSLTISTNIALVNLAGLDNLVSIGSNLTIRGNDELEEITNLQTLTSINGDLTLWDNTVLSSLRGLDNISPATINYVEIAGNPKLADCSINSICKFLNEDDAYYYLLDNAFGCSELENILYACIKPNIETHYNNITISTNLTRQYLTVEGLLRKEQYQIINSSGRLVKDGIINSNMSIDLHNFSNGLYIFILKDGVYLSASSFIKF